jgi:YHS domain-containing protein
MNPDRFSRRTALAALFAACSTVALFRAAPASARDIHIGSKPGVAADGYDVVAYFTLSRPVEGSANWTHDWRGVTWRFASAAHRDAFAANPERYAPAYGGHCSWAASQGYKASGDPMHWRIVDGRLFLNYNRQVHARWLRDVPGFVKAADANWPRIGGS